MEDSCIISKFISTIVEIEDQLRKELLTWKNYLEFKACKSLDYLTELNDSCGPGTLRSIVKGAINKLINRNEQIEQRFKLRERSLSLDAINILQEDNSQQDLYANKPAKSRSVWRLITKFFQDSSSKHEEENDVNSQLSLTQVSKSTVDLRVRDI
ncbi:MAG: hypothetical protein PV340_04985 [Wolbachia sp.]|nr:hypothetical protein [Wolbachia sp.]MDD9336352.1 hypothetical protein [Wolbachia sp.]